MSAIWIRRAAAVLLGIAFAIVLGVALVAQAVTGTFLRPGFYTEQLEQAGAYRFAMADLPTALLEDARSLDPEDFGPEYRDNPLVASGLTTAEITAALQRALSAEDLESLAAPAILEVAGYLTGEQDEIRISVDAAGHVVALADELGRLGLESGAYNVLLDEELEPIFRDRVEDALPAGSSDSGWTSFLVGADGDTADRLVRVFRRVVTPEWLASEVDQALQELAAYLVDDSAGFELRIELDQAQAAAAAAEIQAILGEADAYDLAYDEVIEPALEELLAAAVEVPYGLVITREDARIALRQAAPPAWLEEQATMLASGVSSYVTGQSDGFVAEIALAPVKANAVTVLTEVAVARLEEELHSLPVCASAADAAAARERLWREVPACIPSGVRTDDIVAGARPAITDSIEELVVTPVPDTVRFTESDLRGALLQDGGDDALGALDDLREMFGGGWTYTDADLRDDLADDEDALRVLDEFRSVLAGNWVHTAPGAGGERVGDPVGASLDDAREWSQSVRRGRWVAFVVAAIVLAGVGALGGTSRRGRVVWGSAVLLAVSAWLALLFGPIYGAASGAVFEAIRTGIEADSGAAFGPTRELIADKLMEGVQAVADDFAGGIARNSLVLTALAAVALPASLFWDRITKATGRTRR